MLTMFHRQLSDCAIAKLESGNDLQEKPLTYKVQGARGVVGQEEGFTPVHPALLWGHLVDRGWPKAGKHSDDRVGTCNDTIVGAVVDRKSEASRLLARASHSVNKLLFSLLLRICAVSIRM
jgi:hypothetical protein